MPVWRHKRQHTRFHSFGNGHVSQLTATLLVSQDCSDAFAIAVQRRSATLQGDSVLTEKDLRMLQLLILFSCQGLIWKTLQLHAAVHVCSNSPLVMFTSRACQVIDSHTFSLLHDCRDAHFLHVEKAAPLTYGISAWCKEHTRPLDSVEVPSRLFLRVELEFLYLSLTLQPYFPKPQVPRNRTSQTIYGRFSSLHRNRRKSAGTTR
mmetsp:Transcript_56280/g.150416  ORF Transcript_56280/g.150416 Transcript_56280/m.150416 type:complete len:206 (+) Transcript_56280:1172-1789(+)